MPTTAVTRFTIATIAAGLLAACAGGDGPAVRVLAPTASTTIGIATAGTIQLCIDPASPPGVYSVAISNVTGNVAGDVVAPSPVVINTTSHSGACADVFFRPGTPVNLNNAALTLTASSSAAGTFSYSCSDDVAVGDPLCVSGTTGVNGARASANSAHGTTVAFRFTATHTAPPPPPPPPAPHAPPPPPPAPHAPPPPPPAPHAPPAPAPAPPSPHTPEPHGPVGIPVFVIGDVGPNGVGSTVHFFGSQWWKSNEVSGEVGNGIASFKGNVMSADNFCGGTWTAKPGNHAPDPETVGSPVAVIVTSSIQKSGSTISGNIVAMVLVEPSDGEDSKKWGTGVVTAVTCQDD